jgi:putative PIN family toxin of toxin-antitoxin system
MRRVVIDTNIFVSALRTNGTAFSSARAILRAALSGRYKPLFGNALWLEYEDLLGRDDVWGKVQATTPLERKNILKALAACGQWVAIYFNWRPNLPDEADNHLIELAVAGNAEAIVTYNIKDFRRGQLVWPDLKVLTPSECLEELP